MEKGGRRGAGCDEREDLWVRQSDPPDPMRQAPQIVLPVVRRGRHVDVGVALELVDDQFDDAVRQVLSAGDISVAGHRIDAEVGTKSPHAVGCRGCIGWRWTLSLPSMSLPGGSRVAPRCATLR